MNAHTGTELLYIRSIVQGTKDKTITEKEREIKKPQKIFFTKRFQSQIAYTDDHLLRFVSRTVSLTDRSYRPIGLVSISGAHINQAGRNSSLRPEAKEALDILARKFQEEFKTPLIVISGYRSAAYQQRLWDLGRCSDTHCAPPGNSEHQLWLAIDVFDATTAEDFVKNPRYKRYIEWFQANAHLYGWHQSYQKWESIDGYMVEPWHWRYLWVEMATRLHNLGWTYTEYIQFYESMFTW